MSEQSDSKSGTSAFLNDPAGQLREMKQELQRQRDQMYVLYLAGLGMIALGAAVLAICYPGDKGAVIGFVTGFGVFAIWVLIAFIVERIWK